MNSSEIDNTQQTDRFSRSLTISLGAHIVVLILFAVRAVFFPSEPIVLDDAIRVDLVALPDKSLKQLPPEPLPDTQPQATAPAKPAEPEQPTPIPIKQTEKVETQQKKLPLPKEDKVDLKKNHKDESAAIKRLEAMEKIEQMMKQEQTQPKSRPSTGVVKGNQVSRGGSLSGIARAEFQGYLETVKTSAKRRWNLPAWMGGVNLSTRVRIFINAQGVVVRRQVSQSSGNQAYDDIVLAAIDSASPFQTPPSELSDVLENNGVEIEFVP